MVSFFSDFPDFQKHFLIIFIRFHEKPKHIASSPKGWLNVSTVLGHKLMPSSQRRADNRCSEGPPPPPIIVLPSIDLTMWLLFYTFVFYLGSVGFIASYE